MCVIAISQSGRKIPREWLEDMFLANDDGCGIAFIRNGKVIVRKGFMKLDPFLEFYDQIPETVHVVHFRLATHGGVCPQYTHPFRIDKPDTLKTEYEAKLVLFHNGTIKNYEQFAKLANVSPKNSDTFCLARYLTMLDYKDKLNILVKQTSKFAILSPKTIITIGEFFKKDGFWFSNLHWENYSFIKEYMKYWKNWRKD